TIVRKGEKLCDLGTVDLKPMSHVSGRVVDGAARAVKGALVRLRSSQVPEWDSGAAGYNVFEAHSRADGTFIAAIASGTYTVTALAEGFAPAERTGITVNDSADVGEIELH